MHCYNNPELTLSIFNHTAGISYVNAAWAPFKCQILNVCRSEYFGKVKSFIKYLKRKIREKERKIEGIKKNRKVTKVFRLKFRHIAGCVLGLLWLEVLIRVFQVLYVCWRFRHFFLNLGTMLINPFLMVMSRPYSGGVTNGKCLNIHIFRNFSNMFFFFLFRTATNVRIAWHSFLLWSFLRWSHEWNLQSKGKKNLSSLLYLRRTLRPAPSFSLLCDVFWYHPALEVVHDVWDRNSGSVFLN